MHKRVISNDSSGATEEGKGISHEDMFVAFTTWAFSSPGTYVIVLFFSCSLLVTAGECCSQEPGGCKG